MAISKSCIVPIRSYVENSSVSAASSDLTGGRGGNVYSANVDSGELYLSQEVNVRNYSMAKTEMKIGKKLIEFGIPPHMKGYAYLREAILMLYIDERVIYSITKQMYPPIAKKFATTVPRVEKAIRHTIESSWDRGEVSAMRSCFRYHSTRPTNSEFVAYFFQSLSMNLLDGIK